MKRFTLILFALLSLLQIQARDISDYLIAYYSFTDGLTDSCNNHAEGFQDGLNKHTDISGDGIGSYRFNAKGDYLGLPISLNKEKHPEVTICFWTQIDKHHNSIVFLSTKTRYEDLWFGIHKGYWKTWDTKNQLDFQTKELIKFNEWNFVALSINYEKNRMDVFVNDQLHSTDIKFDIKKDSIYFHEQHVFRGNYFAIDEISVYNKALSKTELQTVRDQVPKVFNYKAYKDSIAQTEKYIITADTIALHASPDKSSAIAGYLHKKDAIYTKDIEYHKEAYANSPKSETPYRSFINNEMGKGYFSLIKPGKKKLFKDNKLYVRFNSAEPLTVSYINKWANFKRIMMMIILVVFLFVSFFILSGKRLMEPLFPLTSAAAGTLLGALSVLYVNDANYFLAHPVLIPSGYGFYAWCIIISGVIIVSLSIKGAIAILKSSLIKGLIGILLGVIWGLLLFVSLFIIIRGAVYLSVLVIFAGILLKGFLIDLSTIWTTVGRESNGSYFIQEGSGSKKSIGIDDYTKLVRDNNPMNPTKFSMKRKL